MATLIEELTGKRPKVVVHTDSTAAMSIVRKTGLCGIKHLDLKLLKLQDEYRMKKLDIVKVDGKLNPADVLTKEVDASTLVSMKAGYGMDRSPEIAALAGARVDGRLQYLGEYRGTWTLVTSRRNKRGRARQP